MLINPLQRSWGLLSWENWASMFVLGGRETALVPLSAWRVYDIFLCPPNKYGVRRCRTKDLAVFEIILGINTLVTRSIYCLCGIHCSWLHNYGFLVRSLWKLFLDIAIYCSTTELQCQIFGLSYLTSCIIWLFFAVVAGQAGSPFGCVAMDFLAAQLGL